MNTARLVPLIVLASCGTSLTWDGPWVEDPDPSGPAELRTYKDEHYRALGTEITGTWTFGDLAADLSNKRVVFLGDRHEDRALHRAQLLLLEELALRYPALALGIEAVGAEDQEDVDAYLQGRIDLEELRMRVRTRWPESWLERDDEVDGAFYRDLLRFARERGLPVRALEPVPRRPLAVRAGIMARSVHALAKARPDATVVAVVGHAHLLGEDHLVDLVHLPAIVVGAVPNRSLERALREQSAPPASARFWLTDAGALLFVPGAAR